MRIEAVTVCVDYADFLRETAPFIAPLVDDWVIVTAPHDHETLDLCRELNLRSVITREFYRDGAKFNKGRGIQIGLEQLVADDWLLHIDADIAPPLRLRESLRQAHLDPDCIHGVDRIMVRDKLAWHELRGSGYLQGGQRSYHYAVNIPTAYAIGTRWASPIHGYVPIGFFQLWHARQAFRNGIWQRPYPMGHGNASRSDVKHALQWDRAQRVLIPECLVAHIESTAELGVNWNGRKSPRFDSCVRPCPRPCPPCPSWSVSP